jgi:hypothetical protein
MYLKFNFKVHLFKVHLLIQRHIHHKFFVILGIVILSNLQNTISNLLIVISSFYISSFFYSHNNLLYFLSKKNLKTAF